MCLHVNWKIEGVPFFFSFLNTVEVAMMSIKY